MSGPYDITWTQWGWMMGIGLPLMALLLFLAFRWQDRKWRKEAERKAPKPAPHWTEETP